jgi:Spy/CpxP family protein refolding chaperone
MKKYLLTLVITLVSFVAIAQGRPDRGEQVKSLKVAFITKELELTSAEAAKFWPIYNAYEEKQRELRRNRMAGFVKRGESEKMTDKEAAAVLARMEKSEDELYDLRKKFMANLKTAISPIKIVKLRQAEEDFNRDLLRQYRQKKR